MNCVKKSFIILIFLWAFTFLASGNAFCQELLLDVIVGYSSNFVPDNWVPISIIVTNQGQSISGEIVISSRKDDLLRESISEIEYIIPVELPTQSKKIFREVIYYRDDFFSTLTIRLISNGQVLFENELELKRIYEKQKVLVVNDNFSGFGFLGISGNEDRAVFYQNVEYLPPYWTGYLGIYLIILDKADYNLMTNKQISALKDWLELGNTVIISGRGSYHTYNNRLIEEIFPAQFIKRESMELLQVPVTAWQIKADNYQVLKKTGDTVLAVGQRLGAGQVIFSLIDFQSPEIKELYYQELIEFIRENQFLRYEFLRYMIEDMFRSIRFYFPERYQIILILLTLVVIIFYLLHLFLDRKKMNLSFFLLIYFVIISIYSGALYIFIYQPIIAKNDIMSEIAVVNLISDSDQAVVDSYISFQDIGREEIRFTIQHNKGSLNIIDLPDYSSFDEYLSLYLRDDYMELKAENNGKKIITGFHSCYKTRLPVYFTTVKDNQNIILGVNNQSQFFIDSLFINYQGEWYSYRGVDADMEERFALSTEALNDKIPWYYWYRDSINQRLIPDSVNSDLVFNILQRIDYELTNLEKTADEMVIVAVLLGDNFEAINTEQSVNRKFLGFLKTSVDLK